MRAPLAIEISRNDKAWPDDLEPLAERAVLETLRQSGAKIAGAAELSIVLTGDAEQQQLNAQWRGIDRPTNVLSFPQIAPGGPVRGLLGDIVLARETLEREAAEQGISFTDHFTHLVVHGFLHILGYDHLVEDEALVMEGLETQILASLGIADPYAGDRSGPIGH
jgi:probable rRNA maturation factor